MSVETFSSIAPYLPLQDIKGSLRWMSATEYSLKSVVRGPKTSKVDSATALHDFIEDLRKENGDLEPLSSKIENGLSRFCAEMEDKEEFFNSILPVIAQFALQLPDLLEHHEREVKKLSDAVSASLMLRVLPPQQSGMVLLHQNLIAALLACAFLCLYPKTSRHEKLGLSDINFDGLYLRVSRANNIQKLLCLVHYFKKVGQDMPGGTVSFERKVLPAKKFGYKKSNGGFWSNSKKPLCEMKVLNNGSLADAGSDYLKIDFANEQLGGGALRMGCVQEEILFMECPECIAGMLFLPTMTNNEAIEIIGVETYSQHAGYRSTFRFTGDHTDNTPRDSWGRRKKCIGAIDALCLPGESQFEEALMVRELNKAYCGFLNHSALCVYNGTPNLLGANNNDVGLEKNLPSAQASGESVESVPDYEANYEVRLERDSSDNTVSLMEIYEANYEVRLERDSSDNTVSLMETYEANYEFRLERDSSDNTVSLMETDEDMSQDRSQQAESTGTCVIHQKLKGVATGNWGAGAFGGNLQLKSLLQWLAASQAGCPTMLYYDFGDPRAERLQEVVDWIHKEGWCVSELWSIVQGYGERRMKRQVKSELYEWILPHGNKELYILRSKAVRFKATAEQIEREDFLMITTHPGRRQLTREVAPGRKTIGCWSWSRRKKK